MSCPRAPQRISRSSLPRNRGPAMRCWSWPRNLDWTALFTRARSLGPGLPGDDRRTHRLRWEQIGDTQDASTVPEKIAQLQRRRPWKPAPQISILHARRKRCASVLRSECIRKRSATIELAFSVSDPDDWIGCRVRARAKRGWLVH
jgi:hypothetical protein